MPRESGPHNPLEQAHQSKEEIQRQEKLIAIEEKLPASLAVYWDEAIATSDTQEEVDAIGEKKTGLLEFAAHLNPSFVSFFEHIYPEKTDKKGNELTLENGRVFIERMEFFKNQFTLPLSDTEALTALQTLNNETKEDAENKIKQWRNLATDQHLPKETPILSLTRSGFTLKETAPKAGPTYKDFTYLQNWELQNDTPTKDALVFFTPRLAPESTNLTVEQQQERLNELKKQYKLPKNHLANFGDASLLTALILAHYKKTETTGTPERIPLNLQYARTGSRRAGGGRLDLGYFDAGGLDCRYWSWDDGRFSLIGVFALGVEELGH